MSIASIYAFILLQAVVSVRPGFVHFVNGKTDIRKFEQLETGRKVQIGPNARVEIGLGPDSLLRVDENSSVVLESLDKADVAVRVESGTAVVEVADIEKPNRIRIASGDLNAVIDSKGVFRFSDNGADVLEGRLEISGTNTIVQKGWHVSNVGDYKQTRLVLSTPQVFKSFLSSPKAGFVNAVHGDVNVKMLDTVKSDQPIQTGPASYAEVLLRPGAFMRVDENSSVVFESTSANDVVVRVVTGSILIETVVPEVRLAIRVHVGGIKTLIAARGLYRFTSDTASVVDGVLRIGKDGEAVFDGMQVRIVDKMYQTTDLKEDGNPSGLDQWSGQRSQLLTKANFLDDYADSQPNFFLFLTDRSYNAAWIYSPLINGITFIPQLTRESYYGNSFVPSYPLMPGPSMLPATMVRAPNSQPTLPAVTPASSQTPASGTTSTPPASQAPAPKPAPAPKTVK
jgi:hypothetical protein